MFVSEENPEPDPDVELIRCARCQLIKPASSFNWRRRAIGQRDTYCRPCRADYHHEHYVKNREKYIAQANSRANALAVERLGYLLEYFASHPCRDCGETDPIVLEFDHRGDKLFNIGSELRHRNWPSILAEIEKCEVVCANCHKRRTAKQRDYVRLQLLERRRAEPGCSPG